MDSSTATVGGHGALLPKQGSSGAWNGQIQKVKDGVDTTGDGDQFRIPGTLVWVIPCCGEVSWTWVGCLADPWPLPIRCQWHPQLQQPKLPLDVAKCPQEQPANLENHGTRWQCQTLNHSKNVLSVLFLTYWIMAGVSLHCLWFFCITDSPFFVFFLLAVPQLWDLCSPTSVRTWALSNESWVLN